MNRAQRRQLARRNGWKGKKSKRGVPIEAALARADQTEQAERVRKIQESAQHAHAMGLWLPGQEGR